MKYAYPLNIMRQIGKITAGVFGGNVVCRKYYGVWCTQCKEKKSSITFESI